MVTTQEIKNIIESSEFQYELAELSIYAASMKQERPIVLLLSKHLWRKGHKAAPELKKCDLDVDGTFVEFKFHFDSDVPGICDEMDRRGVTLDTLPKAIQEKKFHPTWTTTPGIYKDIAVKKANIFVWIICSRNLDNLCEETKRRICWSDPLKKFRKKNKYEENHLIFAQAEKFLKGLTARHPCSIHPLTIKTNLNAFAENGEFPSAYHFILCDFGIHKETLQS